MKTLRLLRNLAVLFILVMALLASWRGVARAGTILVCDVKIGYNCTYNSGGNCHESKCKTGSFCSDIGCVRPF